MLLKTQNVFRVVGKIIRDQQKVTMAMWLKKKKKKKVFQGRGHNCQGPASTVTTMIICGKKFYQILHNCKIYWTQKYIRSIFDISQIFFFFFISR